MNPLFSMLNSIKPLSGPLKEDLQTFVKQKQVRKNEFLLQSGQTCSRMYYIENGLFRCYYDVNDQDVSAWFMGDGEMIISVKSFYLQVPSEENIQALKDSQVLYIDVEQLASLYERHPEFNFYGRILTERYYILSEERSRWMRTISAKDRYLFLLKNHPALLKEVPSKQLASYLGISEFTYSRMRKEVSR